MGIIKDFRENGIPQNNRLKYSDSTLGQGPIISKPVPDDIQDTGFKKDEINSRTDDLKRISTLLTRNQGQKFILNNAALNQLENAQNIGKNIASGDFKLSLGKLRNTVVDQAKDTANLLGSTLAQVPVNGTGTHFVHKFRTDTYLNDSAQAGGILGSLLGKAGYNAGSKTLFSGKTFDNPAEGNLITSELKLESKTGTEDYGPSPGNRDDITPGSNVYLDNTQTNSGSLVDITEPGDVGLDSNYVNASTLPASESPDKPILKPSLSKNPTTRDKKLSNRVRIGDPGKISYSITDRYDINNDIAKRESGIDKINELEPQEDELKEDRASEGRDLIKFRFRVVTPDTQKWLYFRAYLDSFDDSYTGNWNSFNYVGRGEQFHTYSGFDRSISVGFKIAAQSRWEMKPIYQKMVYLASATAPTYSSEGFMRGTFVEMTVGSYLYETPGILESVQYSWDTNYPWEIAMNEPETRNTKDGGDRYQQELPMIMNCQLSFKPIHKFTPETGLRHYITNPDASATAKFFNTNGSLGPEEKTENLSS